MNDKTSNPASAQPQSYVDSYQPPSGNSQSSVTQDSPMASTTKPAQQSDPLAELEKLLKENETEEKKVSEPVADPKKSNNSEQALKELEKLLLEYEDRRKDKAGGRSQLKMDLKPQPKPNSKSQPKKKDPLKELEIALKNYEDRKKQLKSERVTPKKTPEPGVKSKPKKEKSATDSKKSNNSEQALKELEKLLLEYEDRRKDKAGGRPQPKMDLKPQPKPDSKPQPKFERVADAPAPQKPAAPMVPAIKPPLVEKKSNQSIENQNIFELIGANDSNDQEKEAFLDELQEAIWEDFLNKDIELLVTTEELKQLQDLRNQASKNTEDVQLQEKLINEVEKLIPDVEDIMLEKALELKEDLAWERVAGMKEYYQGRGDALQKIEEASDNFKKGQWQAGALILNALVP